MEKCCGNCRWYCSYRMEYDDPLEPEDCGKCENQTGPPEVQPKGEESEGQYTNADLVCEHWKSA